MTAQWAKLVGDGERAEGFEEWMTQTLESHFLPGELEKLGAPERERAESRLRIFKIIVAATIEAARAECTAGADTCELALDISEAHGIALSGLTGIMFQRDSWEFALSQLLQCQNESAKRHLAEMKRNNPE